MNRLTMLCSGFFALLVATTLWEVGEAVAQDPAAAPAINDGTASTIVIDDTPGVRRALIVVGLTGDEDHRKLYAETLDRLYKGLTTHHGFAPENIVLLWSDSADEEGAEKESETPAEAETGKADTPAASEEKPEAKTEAAPAEGAPAATAPAVSAITTSRGPATRESLAEVAGELEQTLQAGDGLWVFVVGHSHYDGRYSWLNVPGPDIQHIELGKMFANLRCREQAFFITTAASGFYFKSLAMPGRIVITATEPDLELNETIYPHHLARTLAEPPSFKELDIDEDYRLTLLDAHLYTCQKIAEEYASGMLIATEHALIDDTGDGRGTEVQADYLTEELGGRYRAARGKPIRRTGDGARMRQILLDYPPSPPSPEEEVAPSPAPAATPLPSATPPGETGAR